MSKVEKGFVDSFLRQHAGAVREEVTTGIRFGGDFSVVALPHGQVLVTASDPLSLLPNVRLQQSAWLSVQLAANDVFTSGVAPQYGQFVLNLPETLSAEDFRTYWKWVSHYAKQIGLQITGGHTGTAFGNHSTIIGGATLSAVCDAKQLVSSSGAQAGDILLMTKSAGILASAVLAYSFPDFVRSSIGDQAYTDALDSFWHISIGNEALLAVSEEEHGVTAMHDVTEGGVLGAVFELCSASDVGAKVLADSIPVEPTHQKICDLFALDPLRTIGAGALLIACHRAQYRKLKEKLEAWKISCTEIGVLDEPSSEVKLCFANGDSTVFQYQAEDAYWQAYINAVQAGKS